MTIPELLREANVPTREAGEHHHVSRGWIGVDCSDCSPNSGRFRLGINLAKNFATCWTCGYKPLVKTLMVLTGRPGSELYSLLAGLGYFRQERAERAGKVVIPDGVGKLSPAHRKYLKRRGLDPAIISKVWGVRGIGLHARLAWRLFIPVHLDGKVVSWSTRAICDENPRRYVSAPASEEAVPVKDVVYGLDHARHAVIVCEGPFDCWKIGPGAVATLGTAYTQAQLLKLSKFPVRAICFDNEPAAQQRATRLANDLRAFAGQTFVVGLDAKDPGSASDKEITELRKRFLE